MLTLSNVTVMAGRQVPISSVNVKADSVYFERNSFFDFHLLEAPKHGRIVDTIGKELTFFTSNVRGEVTLRCLKTTL